MAGRTLIVGVGNVLRGDDGLGPRLVQRLRRRGIPCIDAGSAPERYLGKVLDARPGRVLLVDAVHLGLASGAFRVLRPVEVQETGLSTHDLSLRHCLEFLDRRLPGRVLLLGVQPQRLGLGLGLSGRVARTLRFLEGRLARALQGRTPACPATERRG